MFEGLEQTKQDRGNGEGGLKPQTHEENARVCGCSHCKHPRRFGIAILLEMEMRPSMQV